MVDRQQLPLIEVSFDSTSFEIVLLKNYYWHFNDGRNIYLNAVFVFAFVLFYIVFFVCVCVYVCSCNHESNLLFQPIFEGTAMVTMRAYE